MANHETLGFLLAETARIWRRNLDNRLKPLGLSQAKWLVLVHLHMAEQDLTQRELSEKLGIEGPSLVRLLDRMEADAWVERHESPADRRAKIVHPTSKAIDVVRDIKRIAGQLRSELLADIPDADLATTFSVLERIKLRAEQL